MRVLRAGLGLEMARLAGVIRLTVAVDYKTARGCQCLFGKAERVGSHVGYKADSAAAGDIHALIELLRYGHRAARGHAETARGLLLQCRGDERRRGAALLLAALHGIDGKVLALCQVDYCVDLVLAVKLLLFPVAAIESGGKSAALTAAEMRVEQPVFLTDKVLYLLLAVNDHARCDRLHAPRGQAALDLFPQQRRQLVADDAVEYAARLLRVDQILIDIARVLDALSDDLFGYLIEGDAARLLVRQVEQLLEMPRYSFALAVRVGREIDCFCRLGILLQLVDKLFLIPHGDVLRLEAVLYVNAHLALRQIAQMSHRSRYLITAPEIFFNGLCLSRRFDYDKILRFCHYVSSLLCYIKRHTAAGITAHIALDLQNRELRENSRRAQSRARYDIVNMACGLPDRSDDLQLILI